MAATLISEDGTGLTDANSFVTVAELKAYWNNSGFVYDSFEPDAITVSAIRATRTLEGQYGTKWPGDRKNGTQSLGWPRTDAYYTDGYAVRSTVVPSEVKAATCELAAAHLSDVDLQPVDEGDNQKSYAVVVGPIEEKTEWFSGTGTKRPQVTAAKDALARLVKTGGYGGMRITRI